MRRRRITAPASLGSALLASALLGAACPAGASASFDCTKARTVVERTICASPDLSRLDGELGKAYRALRERATAQDRDRLLADQRAWIAARDRSCGAAALAQPERERCLREAIVARLAVLAPPPDSPVTAAARGARADRGDDRAWTDCLRTGPPRRIVDACTAVLARGAAEPPEARAVALTRRAFARENLGDTEAARDDYEAAIALDRDNAEAQYGLARRLYDEADFEGALGALEEVLRIEPGNASAHYDTAIIYRRYLGRDALDVVIRHLDRAIALDPSHADAFHARGQAHEALRRPRQAVADYRRAAELGHEAARADVARLERSLTAQQRR